MELLKRVLTALVLIPLVLVLVLRAPVAILALVAGLVVLLATYELFKLSESYGVQPLERPSYVFLACFFVLMAAESGSTVLLSTAGYTYFALSFAVLGAFFFLLIAMYRSNLGSGFLAAAVSAFAFLFIALPIASLVQLREQWQGSFLLLYLLLLVWPGTSSPISSGNPSAGIACLPASAHIRPGKGLWRRSSPASQLEF